MKLSYKSAIYILLAVVASLLATIGVMAGNLDSPSAPTDSASQMYTMQQVFDRINTGAAGTKMTTFTEPSGAPGSAMKTLDELYALVSERSRSPKTGQMTSYATGDDGDLEKGVNWPIPRFTDNTDGTVTDNLTGLIWLKNANCTETVGGVDKSAGTLTWANALTWSNNLAGGNCGLTDSSIAGDWRLPNVRELQSLIDYGRSGPALPSSHPFTNVQMAQGGEILINYDFYWASTSYYPSPSYAWYVSMYSGFVFSSWATGYGAATSKTDNHYVWPVRGGQ